MFFSVVVRVVVAHLGDILFRSVGAGGAGGIVVAAAGLCLRRGTLMLALSVLDLNISVV